jgi:hypothetical protein
MRRQRLRAADEIGRLLAQIPIVTAEGGEDTTCYRLGRQKPRYSSAANARRGALAWSWAHGDVLPPCTVVYQCLYCGEWHVGNARRRLAHSA